MTWPDAANGLNHEQALVTTSTDDGQTWSKPANAAEAGDRPDNPAVAIAPDGSTAYLTYNAYLDPWRTGFSAPRRMQGVVRVASVSANGSLGSWQTVHRGEIGDDRATATSRFDGGSIYDYNAAAATRTAGVLAWVTSGARNLPGFFDYYRSVIAGTPEAPPNVYTDCPARFGNTDIYAANVPAP